MSPAADFIIRSDTVSPSGYRVVQVRLEDGRLVTISLHPAHATDEDLQAALAAQVDSGHMHRGAKS